MFGNFQENFHAVDVQPKEFENSEHRNKLHIPTMSELKYKLEHIFNPQESMETKQDMSVDNSSEIKITQTVMLDDGTVVDVPAMTDNKDTVNSIEQQKDNCTDISQIEVKPTRELIEEERIMLQEKLEWTDKQIAKCTIDEDGIIHYKTDREDMEGKIGENGIRYERKNVDIHGVKVQGVFPVFDSVCDVQLPEALEKASNARQFKECNKQLKENIDNDPKLRDSFTIEQLEEIEDGDTPTGYVWHHNEETGKMQLVRIEDHDRTQGGAAHTGGKALWGGGYSSHETPTTIETTVIQQMISKKEGE